VANDFLSRLQEEILVGDGAMGTLLYARGIPLEASFDALNLTRPDLVKSAHEDYVAAGARLIETNTYGANRLKLERVGQERHVREINALGVRLARGAAGADVFVAGSIGPIGKLDDPEPGLSDEDCEAIFSEAIEGLIEEGIDAFILETFSRLDELEAAIRAARSLAPDVPIIAQMAFLAGEGTAAGVRPRDAAIALSAAGADVIGVNCGEGARAALQAVERLARVTASPLSAFPNAGFPAIREGRYVYHSTPEYMAESAFRLVEAGVGLVGGCCGTRPSDIAAMVEAVGGMRPAARAVIEYPIDDAPRAAPAGPAAETFLDVLERETGIIVELDPPKGLDPTAIVAGARRMKDLGVHLISMADNPLARVRMGNVAAALQVRQQADIEPLVHFTCRDRNIVGLQADLIGAASLGLRHVLVVTGDPASVGDHLGATNVYDVRSTGLVEIVRTLNGGRIMTGASIGKPTTFTVGVAFNPNARKMETQVARLERKVEAGAQFALTQPVYEAERIEELYERTAPLGIPVILGILPPASARNADFLHNEVPGIVIPESLRMRLRRTPESAQSAVGEQIALELIDAARSRAPGFYVMPPFGRTETAARVVKHITAGNRE
jgi:methionine synthase / methylenetetrahydrofolate reductase (NADH)